MYIEKVVIKNFKCFEDLFTLELNEKLNIIVGDNEVGKSTIIEAINLVLTGLINGRYIRNEIDQSFFNFSIVENYLNEVNKGGNPKPPEIVIDLYLNSQEESIQEEYSGTLNELGGKNTGIQFKIFFDKDKYSTIYSQLISELRKSNDTLKSLPIEFYDISLKSFSRDPKYPRFLPIKSSLIDSSSTRFNNGSDVYISRIIEENLDDSDLIKISQAHRELKDSFSKHPEIDGINKKINQSIYSKKNLSLEVDISSKNRWEGNLITCLDKIPFHHIGKGEQCLLKTKLALNHKKTKESNLILLEEPENHLSHTTLNELIDYIKANNLNKQIIVSTHSSFVANKLGLSSLIFLNNDLALARRKFTKIDKLLPETKNYFERLPGYDTLRLILCKKAILVEGASDELVVQKAYLNLYKKLPIENGIEVISVQSLAFPRFLEVAEKIGQNVAVVTDNDGDIGALEEKYIDYLGEKTKANISINYDKNEINGAGLKIGKKSYNYNSLEEKMLEVNGLAKLNLVFSTSYATEDQLRKFMTRNKTLCAFNIFDYQGEIDFPQYILAAITDE